MIIQHNIEAMNANRQFNIVGGTLAKSARNLSSGYKINIAADDAAGLSISEKMRKQVRGLSQSSLNAEDGISLVQIADGAMAEIQDMLDRGVELSVKAANGTLSNSDKTAIQQEIDQLVTEIDAIKERTKFNEVYVLKGDAKYATVNVPATPIASGGLPSWVRNGGSFDAGKLSETYTDSSGKHSAASLDFSAFTTDSAKSELIGQGFNSTCCTCNEYYSIQFTDKTVNETITGNKSFIFKVGIGDMVMGSNSPSELIDRIVDATTNSIVSGNPNGHNTIFKKDANNPNKLWIYDKRDGVKPQQFQGWGLFGKGAMNVIPAHQEYRRFELMEDLALQVGDETAEFMHLKLPAISGYALGLDKLDVRKTGGAEESITAFGAAKDQVSADRSRLGAYQNRLEHAVKNLDNVVENTTAAESQIRDTDMATEMVKYSNMNVLSQAGQSMLAQANQSKQGILSLLSA